MTQSEPVLLKRQIGLYAATAITVGSIIGSGIFRSPHSVALLLHSEPLMLFAWVLGGALSMCGSLVLAELAVAHPQTGGLYVFIREGFGRGFGFVFGWASLWVIKPTVIAAITAVFTTYACEALGWPRGAQLPLGLAAIFFLTFVNWLGVREGANTQTVLTTLKVIGILVLCGAAFGLPHAGVGTEGSPPPTLPGNPLFLALAAAMIPILFAYDGWTDSTYVAGEIVDPRRVMPIAILGGTAIVIVVYVVTNLAYFAVLTPPEIASHEAVASEVIRRIVGEWGGRALAVLVSVSTFGTINASILTGPRITLAMAADGLFWKPAAHVSPRRGTPDFALWFQAALSAIWLSLAARGFEDVSGWFVTTSWLFYGITIAAIFVTRRREGSAPAGGAMAAGSAKAGASADGATSDGATSDGATSAPYRTPLYPVVPILFILVTVALIGSDLAASGWRAAAGVGVAALGFPVYYFWKGRRRAG